MSERFTRPPREHDPEREEHRELITEDVEQELPDAAAVDEAERLLEEAREDDGDADGG